MSICISEIQVFDEIFQNQKRLKEQYNSFIIF